jgi:hypothetical protein
MTRFVLLAFIAAACGDSKRKSPFPPLLGKQSDATIAAFEASCDTRFATSPGDRAVLRRQTKMKEVTIIECHIGSDMTLEANYSIMLFRGGIRMIDIQAKREAERIAIFDRVFASIVPPDIRSPMRSSISDPKAFDFATTEGGVFVHASDTVISWETATKDQVLIGRPAVHYQKEE